MFIRENYYLGSMSENQFLGWDQGSLFCISIPVVSTEPVTLELGAAVEPVLPAVETAGAEVPVEPEKRGEDFLI